MPLSSRRLKWFCNTAIRTCDCFFVSFPVLAFFALQPVAARTVKAAPCLSTDTAAGQTRFLKVKWVKHGGADESSGGFSRRYGKEEWGLEGWDKDPVCVSRLIKERNCPSGSKAKQGGPILYHMAGFNPSDFQLLFNFLKSPAQDLEQQTVSNSSLVFQKKK